MPSSLEIPSSEEMIRKVSEELYRQRTLKRIKAVRLPCYDRCHASVEVERAEDQYVACPRCGRSYLMSYSAAGNSKFRYELPGGEDRRYH